MELGHYRVSAVVEVLSEEPFAGDTIVRVRAVVGDDGPRQFYLPKAAFDFEPTVVTPAEPEHGAVVIDADGDAWQNDEGEWSLAGAWLENGEGRHYRQTWDSVVERYGPLKVVYTP
jgi:hypothetical protein